jgi:uroporphyrinogen decarboxylase
MSLYLDALLLKPLKRPPIWMMRQAGRYLPEYMNLRQKYSFMEMMKTPEIATTVTLQPIKRFGFDAAILFSDILTVAESLGANLKFVENKGPVIDNPIRDDYDFESLESKPISEYAKFVYSAIRMIKSELSNRTPLIGFCGAPLTVASYMIEGGSSTDLYYSKQMMGNNPLLFHRLLQKLTNESIQYCLDQITSGVDAIQIFDTWAGLLTYNDFKMYSLPYLKQIVDKIKLHFPNMPITIFSKSTSVLYPLLQDLNINAISFDWQTNISKMKQTLSPDIAIQGNLDPGHLFFNLDELQKSVRHLLEIMKGRPGYIFNLGHGITPKVPVESVKCVVETVKSFE